MHGYGSDERNNANDFQLAISILLQFHMYIFNLVQKRYMPLMLIEKIEDLTLSVLAHKKVLIVAF